MILPVAALASLTALAGCSFLRPRIDEATAMRELHFELAGEPADSDTALILTQALRDAREVPPAERGNFLAVATDRARDARWFKIVTEAPLPEGWPRPSAPGVIRIKTYPSVRTAWARDAGGSNRRFMALFRHIQKRDIAMTAPVVMEYDSGADAPERTGAMAFLYRRVGQDQAGRFGSVAVGDEEPVNVVSVGVKGAYFESKFRRAFAELRDWLAENPEWRPAGMPRVLAYNSPFMPWWLKYSEVQIPVARAEVGEGDFRNSARNGAGHFSGQHGTGGPERSDGE